MSLLRSFGSISAAVFPPSLESYGDAGIRSLMEVLRNRIHQEPLNLWVTLIFFGAILHTFFTKRFLIWAHRLEERATAREAEMKGQEQATVGFHTPAARVLHFLGEVEAVFGIWCIPLFVLLAIRIGWSGTVDYFGHGVSFIEPIFVVIIMTIASTRPILQLAERCLGIFARLLGSGPPAWWLATLTVGPILGSLITEPAAMTICALLLAKQFYALKPSPVLAYATLGLLFVNISVGGALTHFAAPPVLMVATPWKWSTPFMFMHFGWIALTGIIISNVLYYVVLRNQFRLLRVGPGSTNVPPIETPVPLWVTLVHIGFMGWTVFNAHHSALLIGGFLFFFAFHEVTQEFQTDVQLRGPLLVGFFLAGLVVHGGLQQWWIGPLLRRLTDVPLMLGATALTAFNDNAAITFLASLAPDLTESAKYAVVAGALAGGGLTVIANAPNPAGQTILSRYFPDGVGPLGLLAGAVPATVVMVLCFLVRLVFS